MTVCLCLLATLRKNYWTSGGSRIFEEGSKASEGASFLLLLSFSLHFLLRLFPFLSFPFINPSLFLSFHGPSRPSLNSPVYWTDQLLSDPDPDPGFFFNVASFLRTLQHLYRTFFPAWLIFPQLLGERIFMKILSQMYPWTTKPPDFSGRTYAVSDCSCLHYSQQVQQIQNFISSQCSDNQAISLENWGKLYNRQPKMQY